MSLAVARAAVLEYPFEAPESGSVTRVAEEIYWLRMPLPFALEHINLISGDRVLPRISTNVSVWPMEPEGDPLAQYLHSLERLRELPPVTLVLPSHGLPFRGLHRRIDELCAHHEARLTRTLEVCREPRAAAELLPGLFGRDFNDYQLLFAMGEAIAHLNHLMHAARPARCADDDGCYRFERTAH